jgi:hypothetical protein
VFLFSLSLLLCCACMCIHTYTSGSGCTNLSFRAQIQSPLALCWSKVIAGLRNWQHRTWVLNATHRTESILSIIKAGPNLNKWWESLIRRHLWPRFAKSLSTLMGSQGWAPPRGQVQPTSHLLSVLSPEGPCHLYPESGLWKSKRKHAEQANGPEVVSMWLEC